VLESWLMKLLLFLIVKLVIFSLLIFVVWRYNYRSRRNISSFIVASSMVFTMGYVYSLWTDSRSFTIIVWMQKVLQDFCYKQFTNCVNIWLQRWQSLNLIKKDHLLNLKKNHLKF